MYMIRRILLVVASMGLLLALGAAPASAQYQPSPITISDSTLVVGQPFTITVTGQQPGSTGTFTFNSTPILLGSATADAAGTVVFNGTTPNVALGAHTITYAGTAADGSPSNYSLPVTVVAADGTGNTTTTAGTGAGTLPRTGSNSTGTLLPIAAVLVAGGALMVIITRKRTSATAAS
jgi:LPXTG-motif cell wall-anchored protein